MSTFISKQRVLHGQEEAAAIPPTAGTFTTLIAACRHGGSGVGV